MLATARLQQLAIWLAVLITATALASARAAATTAPSLPLSTWALDSGEFRGGLGGSYLSTTSNFDRSGNKQALPGNGSLLSVQADLFLEYGVTSDFTLLATVPMADNQVTGTASTSGGGTVTNATTGIGDLTVGLRYEPWKTPVRGSFDALIQFPLYARLLTDQWANLSSGSPAPLGTGVTEFTLLGRVEIPVTEDLAASLAGGITARTGGFSDLLPYEAYMKYEEKRGPFVRLGVKGYFSVSDDQFASATSPPNDRSTVAEAGSDLYNAINPAELAIAGAVGTYIGKKFFFAVGGEVPVVGRDIAAQPLVVLALGLDFGGKVPQPRQYLHSNRGFQQYYLNCSVIRVNNQLRQILIDKGAGDTIKKGELLDVFEPDQKDGTFGEAIARGRVIEVGPTKSKIQLLEFFKEEPMQEGFVVRRPVR